MIALGVGLGPLMAIVASRAMNTRRAARPLVWLEEDGNEEIDAATSVLVAARELVPIRLAPLVLLPGMLALAAQRFGTHRGRTLVLHAIDESSRASVRW